MPSEAVPIFTFLAENVLEPVREQFGEAITITSGYRDPDANAAAHGVAHSEHMASANWCAADFVVANVAMRAVFDWIRGNVLPYHEVILEHGDNCDIVHISVNKEAKGRVAKEGATANRTPYITWPVSNG